MPPFRSEFLHPPHKSRCDRPGCNGLINHDWHVEYYNAGRSKQYCTRACVVQDATDDHTRRQNALRRAEASWNGS